MIEEHVQLVPYNHTEPVRGKKEKVSEADDYSDTQNRTKAAIFVQNVENDENDHLLEAQYKFQE